MESLAVLVIRLMVQMKILVLVVVSIVLVEAQVVSLVLLAGTGINGDVCGNAGIFYWSW